MPLQDDVGDVIGAVERIDTELAALKQAIDDSRTSLAKGDKALQDLLGTFDEGLSKTLKAIATETRDDKRCQHAGTLATTVAKYQGTTRAALRILHDIGCGTHLSAVKAVFAERLDRLAELAKHIVSAGGRAEPATIQELARIGAQWSQAKSTIVSKASSIEGKVIDEQIKVYKADVKERQAFTKIVDPKAVKAVLSFDKAVEPERSKLRAKLLPAFKAMRAEANVYASTRVGTLLEAQGFITKLQRGLNNIVHALSG